MARNLITRTVTTTSITALVADKAAAEFFNKTVDVPGKVKPENAFQAFCAAAALPEACVPLEIVNIETSAKTYGMAIAEFVQHGKEV